MILRFCKNTVTKIKNKIYIIYNKYIIYIESGGSRMNKQELRIKMKTEARRILSDNKIDITIATVLVGMIIYIPYVLSEKIFTSYNMKLYINIISMMVSVPLMVGLNIICLDCIKGEKVKVKYILKGFDLLYQSYGTILIEMAITSILTLPFICIPIFLVKDTHTRLSMIKFIIIISNTFFYIVFSQLQYIVADKKDISILDAIRKSIFIIKDYIWDYILLSLSFVGWIILVVLTFGIAYIWVGPYIKLTFVNFYQYIKKDKLDIYERSKCNSVKLKILVGFLLITYIVIEDDISQRIFTPPIIKRIIEENNLSLVSYYEEDSYYISEEEGIVYKIEPNYTNLSDLSKYTVVVKKHPLDSKKGDKIDSTVIYIISNVERVLGITCDPNYQDKNIESYNPIPGKFDIKGNKLKR